MAKEEQVLRVDEKKINTIEHAELLKIVVTQKKAELDDLNHKILLAKNNLRSIEEGCRRQQSEFDHRMAIEKQGIERLKVQAHNELAQQTEKNQQAVERINEREMRIQEKENAQVKLDEERKVLYEQRIKLEEVTRNAEEELNKTLALQSEVEGKINQAALKEEKAKKMLEQAEQRNASADYQYGKSSEKEKKVRADLENIQKIRDEITPRIAELQTLDAKNTKTLAEIKQKEDEINAKIKENEQAIENMKKQAADLKEKELEINTAKEELLRQQIIIEKVKGK